MSVRHTSLALLIVSGSLLIGCSKKQQPPPSPPTREEPREEPKPEPKAEPKPQPKSDGPTQLSLPEQPAAGPWLVGKAAAPRSSVPVTIPGVPPQAMTGLAVRPALNRAVATVRFEPKNVGRRRGSPVVPVATRVVFCDTASGTILNEWQIAGDFTALDLSPDGRSILATAPDSGRGRNTLQVWLITSTGKLKPWWFEPHELPAAGVPEMDSGRQLTPFESVEVRWAGFVGNDRIVSVSRAGQLRVWNPDGPKLLASIDSTPARPAITPDGTRVAFLAGDVVALLDPTAGEVTDIRRIGTPPPYPVLAFNPAGTKLAIGGNGRAIILDLATGNAHHAALPRLRVTDYGIQDRSFAWAGNDHLRADQQIHDPNFPIPVWEYRGSEQLQTCGAEAWLSIHTPEKLTSTLRALTLPHTDLQALVTDARSHPERFALKPGDRMRIDISKIPADRQAEVKKTLEDRLRELGYVPDDSGSATLQASVDVAGIKSTVTYVARSPIDYVRRPAKLQLVLGGKVLWSEEWFVLPPVVPRPQPKEPMEKCLERCGVGEPDYDLFKLAPIPAYFPASSAPAVALGSSTLTADGIRDITARRQ